MCMLNAKCWAHFSGSLHSGGRGRSGNQMEHGRWVFCCCKEVSGAVKSNAVQLLKIILQAR